MAHIVYRSDPAGHDARRPPRDATEALDWLNDGNERFAQAAAEAADSDTPLALVIDADLGGGAAAQRPFGIVLGCADARVPIELVFGRAVNDLFVVRIAGNSIGSDGIGSIGYAVHHFPSVRLAAVLGHSACGAVAAAVEAFCAPRVFLDLASTLPLRALVDRLLAPVRAAAGAIVAVHGAGVAEQPGYAAALLDVSVAMNAAYTAHSLRLELSGDQGLHVLVTWGVYDLETRRVGIPGLDVVGLSAPPSDAGGFRSLAVALAGSARVTSALAQPPE